MIIRGFLIFLVSGFIGLLGATVIMIIVERLFPGNVYFSGLIHIVSWITLSVFFWIKLRSPANIWDTGDRLYC